jgi:hypothetical protein
VFAIRGMKHGVKELVRQPRQARQEAATDVAAWSEEAESAEDGGGGARPRPVLLIAEMSKSKACPRQAGRCGTCSVPHDTSCALRIIGRASRDRLRRGSGTVLPVGAEIEPGHPNVEAILGRYAGRQCVSARTIPRTRPATGKIGKDGRDGDSGPGGVREPRRRGKRLGTFHDYLPAGENGTNVIRCRR